MLLYARKRKSRLFCEYVYVYISPAIYPGEREGVILIGNGVVRVYVKLPILPGGYGSNTCAGTVVGRLEGDVVETERL